MWIFSVTGFYSVVTDNQKPGRMLIRARTKTDIDNLFRSHRETCPSMEPPTSDESRDYRYRLSISKRDWLKLAAKLAESVTYPNFKMVGSRARRPSRQDRRLFRNLVDDATGADGRRQRRWSVETGKAQSQETMSEALPSSFWRGRLGKPAFPVDWDD